MLAVLGPVARVNTHVLRICRAIAWAALAAMVAVILLQVAFRYGLNAALAWPDEAARFLMLWMTGLMAPSAYRWGGFVAIDMLPRSLPRVPGLLLELGLFSLSLLVLVVAARHGWEHTMGFAGRFDSASLRLPLDWIGIDSVRVKLRYMHASLLTGVLLLIAVNVELILRTLVRLADAETPLPHDDAPAFLRGAE